MYNQFICNDDDPHQFTTGMWAYIENNGFEGFDMPYTPPVCVALKSIT